MEYFQGFIFPGVVSVERGVAVIYNVGVKKYFLIALGLGTAACASSTDPVERGASRFVGLGCVSCHHVGERGGGQAGPDLTTTGLRHSKEWLDLWMKAPKEWKPNTTMPSLKLKDNVRGELVAYLATLRGESYRQKPPWNSPSLRTDPVKRGEIIYSRAGCVACHGFRGQGGFPNNNVVGNKIPSLTMAREKFTKEELIARIRLGRTPVPADPSLPPPMIAMPAWGDYLTSDEMDDLASYIFSFRPTDKPGEGWFE